MEQLQTAIDHRLRDLSKRLKTTTSEASTGHSEPTSSSTSRRVIDENQDSSSFDATHVSETSSSDAGRVGTDDTSN